MMRRGPRWIRLYLDVFSGAYGREHRAVAAGIATYSGGTTSGDVYLLRRNIHMIEKGLTMVPRRKEFALDYIERTIDAYCRARLPDSAHQLGSAELNWMQSVLNDYWNATSKSDSETIKKSRDAFHHFEESLRDPTTKLLSGPHPPLRDAAAVTALDLLSLAKQRRSVRWFEQEPVPRECIEIAIETGIEAPSACNRQPYRFLAFDDPHDVSRIVRIPMGTRGYSHQIPGVIVVIGDLSAFFDPRDRHLIYVDSCLASMGLILSLEAQGVATCCINWPDIPEKEAEMSDLLGLEVFERTIMVIVYGYAKPDSLVPFSAKKQLTESTTFGMLKND